VQKLSKKQLLEEIARLNREMTLLRQKMDLLLRRMFGRSSEKMEAGQLDLFLLNLEDEAGKGEASSLQEADAAKGLPRGKSHPRRERWPENLPVVEEIIEPREVQAAPADWRLIGAEVSEQLDYEPARFLRRRLVGRKYVKRAEAFLPPVIAPLPPSLQERCLV